MRLIIIGAGAVGAVLGVNLEHTKNEIMYLVRKGKKKGLGQLMLVDAATGTTRCRERPPAVEEGDNVPPFEWALLCVRGDQIAEALETLQRHARPDAKVGLAVATLCDMADLRASWPGGPVFTILPTFSAWSEEPNVWKFFHPPLLKTIVSGEGDPAADAAATEFAAALNAAKIPALALPQARRKLATIMAPGLVLLAGWELSGWDIKALASDGGLRKLTAAAMSEAARAMGPEAEGPAKLLAYAPAFAVELFLRSAPLLAPENVSAMWRVHGPKVRAQTRDLLDELLARKPDLARVRELRDRLPALA